MEVHSYGRFEWQEYDMGCCQENSPKQDQVGTKGYGLIFARNKEDSEEKDMPNPLLTRGSLTGLPVTS